MAAAKIAISIDPGPLERVDSLVRQKVFRSRSEVFQIAIVEQTDRLDEDASHFMRSHRAWPSRRGIDPTHIEAMINIDQRGLNNGCPLK